MFRSKWLPATVLVAATSAMAISPAHAFGDDEAAILVGVAVGGLTTYALQNARRDHPHYHGGGHESYYERREYREPHHGHHSHQRSEHYVIHNPPQYYERGYERVSHRGGHGRGHHRGHRGGGYEYEYEYSRRGAF